MDLMDISATRRLTGNEFDESESRHFYAHPHQGFYAVFEQTSRPGRSHSDSNWRVCVDGILYFLDAVDLAERMNSIRLARKR